MKQNNADYQVVPLKGRRAMAFAMRSVQHKPMIHGLLEVDVTRARAHLRDHKAKTGESLSFTAFIAMCLGKAVDENKSVQACHKGRKHLILFDDVDVATTIERDVAGQKQPMIYIIRAANKKTFREINQESTGGRSGKSLDTRHRQELGSVPADLSDEMFLLGLLVSM